MYLYANELITECTACICSTDVTIIRIETMMTDAMSIMYFSKFIMYIIYNTLII